MEPATKKQKTETTQECPVCMEIYKDARVLNCGHHFCCSCLQKISDTSPDKWITCPVCRAVTKDKVPDLPKFDANISAVCAFCVTPTRGTMTCFDCKIVLCKPCGDVHAEGTREFGHNVTRISSHQFCQMHPGNFVFCECTECCVFLCGRCIPKHRGHPKESLTNYANHLQQEIELNKLRLQDTKSEEDCKKLVMDNLLKLKLSKVHLNINFNRLDVKLLNLHVKLGNSKKMLESQLTDKIEDLEKMKTKIEEFSSTKTKYLESLDELLSGSSAAETVAKYRGLPPSTEIYMKLGETKSLIPEFGGYMEAFALLDRVATCIDGAKLKPETLLCSSQPFGHRKLISKFHIKYTIKGVCFGTKEDSIIVHTSDRAHPILIYDIHGIKKEEILVDLSKSQRVAVDSKRGLLLLPTDEGTLTTLDLEEISQRNSINIAETGLKGVTYCEGSDQYIVTSKAGRRGKRKIPSAVYLVKPGLENCVQQFAKDHIFKKPYHVYSYRDNNGRCRVVISDYGRDSVELFSLEGDLIHTFKGRRGIKLRRPAGVTADPAGRILVCEEDRGVVSLWLDNGRPKHVVLSGMKKLSQSKKSKRTAPRFINCDRVKRRIVAGYDGGWIHVYGER